VNDDFNYDVSILKEWLRDAWRLIPDPSLTVCERREIRHSMKEAEIALRLGIRRSAEQEIGRRVGERTNVTDRRLEFRILQLDG